MCYHYLTVKIFCKSLYYRRVNCLCFFIIKEFNIHLIEVSRQRLFSTFYLYAEIGKKTDNN
jgi:hypothetical protein